MYEPEQQINVIQNSEVQIAGVLRPEEMQIHVYYLDYIIECYYMSDHPYYTTITPPILKSGDLHYKVHVSLLIV
jgi:hypothetical protein